MLQRRVDWPERLNEKIEELKNRPFVWGTLDCCIFTADIIQAMTDVDVFAEFRGKYTDLDGAHDQIKATGKNLGFAVSKTLKKYGCVQKPVNRAGRGDLVLTTDNALGIVSPDGRLILALTQSGLAYYPLSLAKTAWGIE